MRVFISLDLQHTKEHLHLVLGTLQRDLKPRNVVFSKRGRAKLTDFGMGRIGRESGNLQF